MINRYKEIRSHTEFICKPLQIEDYIPQPVAFASPPKWHLAHTTWFFEEMILKKNLSSYKEFNSSYNFLFNSYYQSIGERSIRTHRGVITRPSVEEIYTYRSYVDNAMLALIDKTNSEEIYNLIELGLNHEQQHQELLISDLKYVFSLNPTYPIYKSDWKADIILNNNNSWITINEGLYNVGFEGNGFHFDNETGNHKVYLNSYKIATELVSNGDYIDFIESGGYNDFNYWLDEGWHWIKNNKITAPLYWVKKDGVWYRYTLNGLVEINRNAILQHINFYEANAFANYKNCRIPTEFEWEVAADYINWGNCWEWTYSAYLPYPNFKKAKGAVGEYNGKFMINQMVLRGASSITSKNHSRKTYRNFFHPEYQWQYSGIRLAK